MKNTPNLHVGWPVPAPPSGCTLVQSERFSQDFSVWEFSVLICFSRHFLRQYERHFEIKFLKFLLESDSFLINKIFGKIPNVGVNYMTSVLTSFAYTTSHWALGPYDFTSWTFSFASSTPPGWLSIFTFFQLIWKKVIVKENNVTFSMFL